MKTKTKLFSKENIALICGIVFVVSAIIYQLSRFILFSTPHYQISQFIFGFWRIPDLIIWLLAIGGILLIMNGSREKKLPIGLMSLTVLLIFVQILQTLLSKGAFTFPVIVLNFAFWLCFAIYTIVCFIKRKPNTVFLGKLFWGLLLLAFILTPIVTVLFHGGYWDWFAWVQISLCLIALAYLFFSKQIQTLFPTEQRTIFTIDKVIAVVAIISISVSIILGSNSYLNSMGLFMLWW